MADDNYSLIFAFPDQSASFAHGFACGRIWEKMKSAERIEELVLAETRPMIEAMCMSRGWVEQFTDIGDGWLHAILVPPAEKASGDGG
jgi:hypothetical protein